MREGSRASATGPPECLDAAAPLRPKYRHMKHLFVCAAFVSLKLSVAAAAPPTTMPKVNPKAVTAPATPSRSFTPVDSSPYFDIPMTYNTKVRWWINYFQTGGRRWFRTWLERSHAFLPGMKNMLARKGLPQDLAYVAMIESGFSPHATSTAEAVGYWQFITPHRQPLRTEDVVVVGRAP